ncbi:site-specific DNA-methyltransferase [Acinetobacter nosocomialis]|uniref:site-specific DNA-methyltransferase n=1 Tax=Acinetobacter calcoaceticus/baumannii complex TaxID=909768 RepID=UPI00044716D3|nr:site-specific DNA-methyltransferase [Acinetobacter baumannii]EXA87244.1 DNA methylase family protein [Acinetobacter baumannii 118362]SSS79023.1 Modification methylase DpnIIB [Acinetobacter baumannii]
MTKTKLELTWIGKDKRPRLEPRILLEDPSKSYHATSKVSENDIFDNKLIFGDNLLALKALEREYAGKVKCIFIDPPYNTGSAFTHYDDGLEHSIWLGLMRDRLEIIRNLLSEDGSLWITIDDNEAHYLKVLLDEIFGRANFVANSIWQKVYSQRMDAKLFSVDHDHLIIYRKSEKFEPNKLHVEQNLKQFNSYDEKTGKYYRKRSLRKEGSNSRREDRPNLWYAIKSPDNTDIYPIRPSDNSEGNWRWSKDTFQKNLANGLVEFSKTSRGWEVFVKQFAEESPTRPPSTVWLNEEVGNNHEAKNEAKFFNGTDVFSTPKPERLLERIIHISTNQGDLVLDSFAGSGTTGAVAHKMGRRWIMVELGEHCHTHIIPRLQKVIDGEDKGGVTESTGWQGGGGFRYYKLAPSLMKKDQWDNWVINPEYNQEMLVEAMCKLEGYTYTPSETEYWNHGKGSETDFIYVTTQTLTDQQLQAISEEVGEGRTLLIIASAWRSKNIDRFTNLTLKKIPNSIIKACEWGHDDYSLNVQNLPMSEPDIEEKPKARKVKNTQEQSQVTGDLFGDQT